MIDNPEEVSPVAFDFQVLRTGTGDFGKWADIRLSDRVRPHPNSEWRVWKQLKKARMKDPDDVVHSWKTFYHTYGVQLEWVWEADETS